MVAVEKEDGSASEALAVGAEEELVEEAGSGLLGLHL